MNTERFEKNLGFNIISDNELCYNLLKTQIPQIGVQEAIKSASWVFVELDISEIEKMAMEISK